jgi:5-methylcytosine-specific restriction endonuclease McrA
MPYPIESYTLPGGVDVPPTSVKNTYRLKGFSEETRNWHIERLPRMTIPSATYIMCPWCERMRDRRSMQIDHVLPCRPYVRLKLYKARNRHSSSERKSALDRLYNDKDNVLLSCTKCNIGGGDAMPTIETLNRAIKSVEGSDLEERLKRIKAVRQELDELPDKADGIVVKEWVWNGAATKTHKMATRFNPIDRKPLGEVVDEIENLVISRLVKTRPMWRLEASDLQPLQPNKVLTGELGRLCFYCLGLFNKQALQLDHINPASRRAEEVAVYNDAKNIIPVCRTCNTAKGNMYLSTSWLDEQIERRKKELHPGVEDAEGVAPPKEYKDYLEYARMLRIGVLER